jgi:hypothetical protein
MISWKIKKIWEWSESYLCDEFTDGLLLDPVLFFMIVALIMPFGVLRRLWADHSRAP